MESSLQPHGAFPVPRPFCDRLRYQVVEVQDRTKETSKKIRVEPLSLFFRFYLVAVRRIRGFMMKRKGEQRRGKGW